MLPATRLRILLARDRERGRNFGECWPSRRQQALASVTPSREEEAWREVFDELEDAWRAAYERRAGPGCSLELENLADLADNTDALEARRAALIA